MKLLKLLWAFVGDDRTSLCLVGMLLAIAVTKFGKGDYEAAVMDLVIAAVVGFFAWRDIGKDRAVQL